MRHDDRGLPLQGIVIAAMKAFAGFRSGQQLLDRVHAGDIDPSFVISHRVTLDEAPSAYSLFNRRENGCTKVVMRPS